MAHPGVHHTSRTFFSRSGADGPFPKARSRNIPKQEHQHLPVHQEVESGCITCLGSEAHFQPCSCPCPGGPRERDAPDTKSTCPIQSAMKEGLSATQHRVMIKCWRVFEGSADLGTAHPPQPQAPRRRRGSPACASQGAKLAAQQAVGSLGMRGVRRKHAPARETARFQNPPRAGSRPSTPLQGEGSGVRSAPERLQIDSGFEG